MEKLFEEDVVCDDCHNEIDGYGIPSGCEEGSDFDGYTDASSWMHRDVEYCDFFRGEEQAQRMLEDGEYEERERAPLRFT